MQTKVELNNSFIIVDEKNFKIGNEKYDISLSFSLDYGFAIERFCNKQGNPEVGYSNATSGMYPNSRQIVFGAELVF